MTKKFNAGETLEDLEASSSSSDDEGKADPGLQTTIQ
jgi:hypothetical protein